MNLIKQVEETIKKYDMILPGDRVVVAVSGGLDSVCLLDILIKLSVKWKLEIYIAHLNHNLRGKESDRDAEFVEKLAKDSKLPCKIEKIDVAKYACQNKLTIEEAARNLRYEFLENYAGKVKANKIAVAHNAHDQVETVLMRILRGTGVTGLGGIPPVRKWNKVSIIRPLIETFRNDMVSYISKNKLKFCLDSSNLKPVYKRNKIRLELLPLLQKEYNPKITQAILNLGEIARYDKVILEKLLERVYQKTLISSKENKISLALSRFLGYNKSIQRGLLRLVIERLTPQTYTVDFGHIEKVIKLACQSQTSKKIGLGNNLFAEIEYDKLILFLKKKEDKQFSRKFLYKLPVPGTTVIRNLGLTFITKVYKKRDNFVMEGKAQNIFLDYGKLTLPLVVRNRRAGDRFGPLGMAGSKKLKNYFIEHKIVQYKRDFIPLVVSANKIVWVLGFPQIADFAKITDHTKNILEIKVNYKKPNIENQISNIKNTYQNLK